MTTLTTKQQKDPNENILKPKNMLWGGGGIEKGKKVNNLREKVEMRLELV